MTISWIEQVRGAVALGGAGSLDDIRGLVGRFGISVLLWGAFLCLRGSTERY